MDWEIFLTTLFASTIRLAIPILLATLGEIFSQRSGVLNLGIEGMMLMGALGGFIGAHFTGSLWFGVLSGIIIGGLFGLIHAVFSVTLGANQMLSGIGLYMLGWGLSSFLFRAIFGLSPVARLEGFSPIHIPILSQIPILGPILFQQNILVYLTFLLVPLFTIILFRTTIGLKIRAVGHNPMAADTLGISVFRIRYLCVILGGMLAGVGGAYLVLAEIGVFTNQMTASRGWIAVALVVFSKWLPSWAMAGALLFGLANAMQLRFQALGVAFPYQFLLMLPYILTIIALIMSYRRAERPAALTRPYKRG